MPRIPKSLKKSKRRAITILVVWSWIVVSALTAGLMRPAAADVISPAQAQNSLPLSESKPVMIEVVGSQTYEEAESRAKVKGTVREVTAYNSVPEQTDDTPCISADGRDICKRYAAGQKLCAANFVPLGTVISVQHYGDCTVVDRMNRRYPDRVDVYLGMDVARARKWGRQNLEVKIIE